MAVKERIRYPIRESPFNYKWDELKNRLILELHQTRAIDGDVDGLATALRIMVAFEEEHREEIMKKPIADEGCD